MIFCKNKAAPERLWQGENDSDFSLQLIVSLFEVPGIGGLLR